MNKEKVLELKSLSMTFGEKQVLEDIDLEVHRGEIIGYIGPNGAGKSTTIKLILGLLDGYKGTIEVFGKDIKQASENYKQRIGYVPESADMYDQLTVSEYLTFTGELYGMKEEAADQKAQQLLEKFDLLDVYHQPIATFSKGMRQKVLLVSSLLHNPDVVFLDEPLNGLDANSVIIVKEILRKLAEMGKTIFYSSHMMDIVENISNRIIVLADGKLIADGSFEDLKRESSEGSLEAVFNQLTGFDTHEETADAFVRVLTKEAGDGHE